MKLRKLIRGAEQENVVVFRVVGVKMGLIGEHQRQGPRRDRVLLSLHMDRGLTAEHIGQFQFPVDIGPGADVMPAPDGIGLGGPFLESHIVPPYRNFCLVFLYKVTCSIAQGFV